MILPTVTVYQIGSEGEPVAVIENFASDPGALRDDAATRVFGTGDNHYPGVKSPAPACYLESQWAVLGPVFSEVFGIMGKVGVLDVSYALVTIAPATLGLEQRLPHVDALALGRLALIHYLVPGGCDGTAFYRHRKTGFETVDQARSAAYYTSLNDDLRTLGQPPLAYLDDSTPLFERIHHFDGHYNRALVYRGRVLHSGSIAADRELSADPLTGRLTITGFFAAD